MAIRGPRSGFLDPGSSCFCLAIPAARPFRACFIASFPFGRKEPWVQDYDLALVLARALPTRGSAGSFVASSNLYGVHPYNPAPFDRPVQSSPRPSSRSRHPCRLLVQSCLGRCAERFLGGSFPWAVHQSLPRSISSAEGISRLRAPGPRARGLHRKLGIPRTNTGLRSSARRGAAPPLGNGSYRRGLAAGPIEIENRKLFGAKPPLNNAAAWRRPKGRGRAPRLNARRGPHRGTTRKGLSPRIRGPRARGWRWEKGSAKAVSSRRAKPGKKG